MRLKFSSLLVSVCAFCGLALSSTDSVVAQISNVQDSTASLPEVIDRAQPKMAKIFGAGGFSRLESWQTGFFVSGDGLLVTVWSYVLDGQQTTVVLDDGRRVTANLVGYHPQYEIALLKADLQDQPHFNLDAAGLSRSGQPILAFSNLYGVATGNEQCSVQTGIVSSTVPLRARRGTKKINYNGPAIIVDAITNNPGAAGGALTDQQGNLLGLIGRESRSETTNLWLNYAIPAEQVSVAMDLIRAGQATESLVRPSNPTEFMTLELLGLVLVADVVERTPPFVDQVIVNSPADKAGLQPDDLIVDVNGSVVTSSKDLVSRLKSFDRDQAIKMTLQRGDNFLTVDLNASGF